MATHFSILAWCIPWTEKPSGLQSTWLQRVRHNLSNLACMLMDKRVDSWATLRSRLGELSPVDGQGMQVPSLVREVRSHMPPGQLKPVGYN